MRLFQADKEYEVCFLEGNSPPKYQQLSCWAEDPELTKESAQKRLCYQRGWGDELLHRIKILKITPL